MTVGDWMNLFGRLFVALYFLWAAAFNMRTWEFNLSEFKRIGLPGGKIWLPAGVILQTIASLLLVYPGTVFVGAIGLVAFVLAADVMFHRYWTYAEPAERTMHLQFLMEHVALVGGIIGLSGSHVPVVWL